MEMSFIFGFLEVFKPESLGYLAGIAIAYLLVLVIYSFFVGFIKAAIKQLKGGERR